MRNVVTIATIVGLITGPALAQTATRPNNAGTAQSRSRGSAEGPIDRGPFTPEANRAYQGGGVILQGEPGGPAPVPEATPPGQMPRNMVPPR